VFGDSDDQGDSAVGRLHDGVPGRTSRNKNHTGADIVLLYRVLDTVIDRYPVHFLALFTRGHSGHHALPAHLAGIGIHQRNVEGPLFSGGSGHQDAGAPISIDHRDPSTAA
jgi:hypothetical protein